MNRIFSLRCTLITSTIYCIYYQLSIDLSTSKHASFFFLFLLLQPWLAVFLQNYKRSDSSVTDLAGSFHARQGLFYLLWDSLLRSRILWRSWQKWDTGMADDDSFCRLMVVNNSRLAILFILCHVLMIYPQVQDTFQSIISRSCSLPGIIFLDFFFFFGLER